MNVFLSGYAQDPATGFQMISGYTPGGSGCDPITDGAGANVRTAFLISFTSTGKEFSLTEQVSLSGSG